LFGRAEIRSLTTRTILAAAVQEGEVVGGPRGAPVDDESVEERAGTGIGLAKAG
jgi:hypothetical protein